MTGASLGEVTAAALLATTTVTLPPPRVVSASEVQILVPAGTTPGRYQLRLDTPAGTALSAADALDVLNLTDPDRAGAFAAGAVEETMTGASGDTVAVRIAYPAHAAGPDALADPDLAPYPAVVLLHAFKPPIFAGGIDYRGYTDLADHLASFGYVVISPDLAPNNDLFGTAMANAQRDADDARAALDHLAARSANPSNAFFGLVDRTRSAVVGHSRGGDGALIACADEVAAGTARFLAVATLGAPALDPTSPGARLPLGDFSAVPALAIGASQDRIVPYTDAQDLFARSGSPAEAFEIVGGNHSQYTDSGALLPFDGTPSISAATQHAIVRRYLTAFFGTHVAGRVSVFAPFLQGGSTIVADTRIRGRLWK